ncbi:MAG: HAMP domain-containing sensor histidine kinase [Bacteroidota bacterium]
MKKRLVTGIVIITMISLLGIAITQILWVKRAIRLRTEQFDDMVNFGLLNVVDQVKDAHRDSLLKISPDYKSIDPTVIDSTLKSSLSHGIDTLLHAEFGCLRINEEFSYGVYDSLEQKILYGKYDTKYTAAILHSPHKVDLNIFFRDHKHFLSIFFPEQNRLIIRRMDLWILILSGVFLLIVIISFLVIIIAIQRQKKLSEMKNDFVNNMTHEFKTPISTISVSSEMLMKPAVFESPEKTLRYANIIFDENLRLRNQVEQALQISLLEKKEFRLKKAVVDVHKIIENNIDLFNLILQEKGGRMNCSLQAQKFVIEADEVHFINIISNLLDNAIKYSPESPTINISTQNNNKGIIIRISDNGIGIKSEDQKHLFKKFYRVHTGNIHDVKGFGLGLFYVKTVVDAHHGYIRLIRSELKKGSEFELFFPFNLNTK